MFNILYDIEIWFRMTFGLGPKRKLANIYWKDISQEWVIRPIIDVPYRAYIEASGEEKRLGSDESEETIIGTIRKSIESCRYSKDYRDAASLKGWKKFVEEHYLIMGELRNSSLCFEPWIRKQKGHKNGHYVPHPTSEKLCAPINDIDKAYLALCNAKKIAIDDEK